MFHVEPANLEPVPRCPICDGVNTAHALRVTDHSYTKEKFNLVDCTDCGHRRTAPRPDQRQIGRYYDPVTYISHSNAGRTLLDRVFQLARSWALRKKYALVRSIRTHGKVLDIGCGTGEFLGHLKSRGYLVTGLEPDLGAREQAIINQGITVLPSIKEIPGLEQFDIISMFHVLEHMPEPHATMKQLYARLSASGSVIIAVPDRGSWDAAHYQEKWAAYDAPRHLQHFRQQDMKRLFEEHGFDLIQVRRMWMDAFYICLLSERYLGRPPVIAWPFGILKGAWSNLMALLSVRTASSTLYIATRSVI